MEHKHLKYFYDWFADYTGSFVFTLKEDQRNIDLKIAHTYRVRDAIRDIGKSLQLPHNDLLLAETMALFHDTGRFQQYHDYGTFKDAVSVNHAKLGVAVLMEFGALEVIPEDERQVILEAIYYHNAPVLPDDLSGDVRFFACLLRDADKVDILRVVTEYYEKKHEVQNKTVELDLKDKDAISDSIYDNFMKGTIIRAEDMVFLNDFKLLQLAWIHDMNFRRSFELIDSANYLEKIIETLPAGERKESVSNHVKSFLRHQLSSSVQH